jgi:hypothetical protein
MRTVLTKGTRNIGKKWTKEDLVRLRELAHKKYPTRVIGLILGRTANAVRSKAGQNHISLRQTP